MSFGWMSEIRARSVVGMILTEETDVRGEKRSPVLLCSPQIQEGGEYCLMGRESTVRCTRLHSVTSQKTVLLASY
jgi:hypothetical protein